MRLGFLIPGIDDIGGPPAVAQAAKRAEALGYDSLWVAEDRCFPTAPPGPAAASDRAADAGYAGLGPLAALAIAALNAERIALGVTLRSVPFCSPLTLARDLKALDVLSNGRIRIGLGLGWTADEFRRVSTALRGDTPAGEFLRAFAAIWPGGEVDFLGEYFRIPRAAYARPVQRPAPPIALTAFTPAAVQPTAVLLNGWDPSMQPVTTPRQALAALGEAILAAEQTPEEPEVVVRAGVAISEEPLDAERRIFSGSAEQLRSDIDAVRALGVAEVVFDLGLSPAGPDLERLLAGMATLSEIAGRGVRRVAAPAA